MVTLVDAGPLYAILNEREHYHEWAVREARQLDGPFHTCEAVISETYFLLRDVFHGYRRLGEMLESGQIVLSFSYADHAPRVHELMRTYENVPMSFADACLTCIAEQAGAHEVFSTDSDFRIYRLREDEPLAVRLP